MKSSLLLSIIVPCYNVEKYISRCIESLLQQDIPYDDYEIIIVNDGSTDDTPNISEMYGCENKHISVVSQSNKGIGAARNTGILNSNGKYLLFVDADDYLEKNILSCLIKKVESLRLEVLRFNYAAIDRNLNVVRRKRNSTYSVKWDEKVIDGERFLTENLGWACYVWMYLFDANFIKQNNMFFKEGIVFEDVEWLVRVMLKAQRVMSFNKQVYYYVLREGSVTNSANPENKNKIISDKLFVVHFLKQLSHSTSNPKVSSWCEGLISLTFMGILAYAENELPERKKEVIQVMRNQKFFPLKAYRFTLKQKRDMHLININPFLYCYLKRIK